MMKRQALFAAALLLFPAPHPAGAETAALSPGDMAAATIVALETGQPGKAAALADALLTRNPDDHQALLLASRAYRNAGRPAEATARARRAWKLAGTQEERYASALVMAQALASANRRPMAQLWLRRAAHHAPNARLRQQAERDFRYVRARNPLSLHFSFGITPKSNINNGSSSRVTDLFGLPDVVLSGAALALSGTEFAYGFSGRYRIAESSSAATDLTFSALRRDYRLSSSARRTSPTSKGSDFALAAVSAGVKQRFMSLQSRRETTVAVEFGKLWYGGTPHSDYVRTTLGYTAPLSRVSLLGIELTAERQIGKTAPDADLLRFETSYSRRLNSGARIGLNFAGSRSKSPSSSADYTDVEVHVSYAPKQRIIGSKPEFGLGYRVRDYDQSPYLPTGGRHDRELAARALLSFDQYDYYGFHPVVTFTASRTTSNVGLFEMENLGASIGFRSAF